MSKLTVKKWPLRTPPPAINGLDSANDPRTGRCSIALTIANFSAQAIRSAQLALSEVRLCESRDSCSYLPYRAKERDGKVRQILRCVRQEFAWRLSAVAVLWKVLDSTRIFVLLAAFSFSIAPAFSYLATGMRARWLFPCFTLSIRCVRAAENLSRPAALIPMWRAS
jgi:hypothetical protein